ncbi:hypothetical protein C5B91_03450 [Haloferax sp. Atlit-10N]|uniref:Glycerophosphoryl diester phosphodiesterase membrane domain-containing protein n=1 Tax=Haloferax prahovense (strain DSM 18310 / JCM 13924 / TL6) TaxID=1227461 RepID=M0GM67_HALPT|nr:MULTISPECIES: hypothetical protein [Haloferax]ELZ73326.1 hypothetical protein C457_05186 [Haloferax prahovense DSM 18310]RDZ45993.1 hypothetical protein C5B86_09665 [Haloferax sp. Atlit-19N]RDZ46735.1 hypothetical protein C5B87_03450 [Haloferax sp. Atlit-16N]RDZ60567.1 hypothetical protein C5B91_03450 [Haloferax sp. Atlit-10N]
MSWKAIDALDDARDATASLLLPFDAGRWARLALIALFVGGLGGSGGAGSNTGTTTPTGGGSTDIPVDSLPGFVTPENVVAAVIAIAAVAIALSIVWSFVGSVMQFVLVDAVVTKDVRIRKPFRERFWLGVRLFGFQVGLLVAVLAVIGIPVAAVFLGSVAFTPAVALFAIPLVLLGLLLVFVLAVVMQLTTDFVVPTMIAEDRALLSSWGRVVPVFRAEFSEFGLYVIVRFILGILASIGIGIAALLALLVVAIPFAIVGGGAFLALNAANVALTSTVGLVVFGALGLLFVLAAIAVGAVVQMPVVTYFRYYSLFLLGSADDSLDLVSQFRSDDDSSAPEGPTPA